MILAGGEGSRLSVLSEKRAKPAVPFGGIYRIIDFTLSNVMHSEVPVLGICTQYKPYSLMDHVSVGETWGFARRGRIAKVLPPYKGEVDSDWYAGTADAIYQNLEFLARFHPDLVLILSGDHVYRMDYRPMIAYHLECRAALTVACQEVPLEEASRFGIAETDLEGRIVGFQEKPKETPRSNLANLGIYVFDAAILAERLRADAHDKKSSHDFGKNLIPAMIASDLCYAYRFSGYWRDVGTYQSYWQAHMDLLDPRSGLEISRWEVCTAIRSLSEGALVPARIRQGGRVERSIVSFGCQIEGVVRNSVLSPGVQVAAGAVVEESVVLHDARIGRNCVVRRSIIDKLTVLHDGAVVGARLDDDGAANPLRAPVTLLGKQVEIPAGYTVGEGCIIPFGTGPRQLPAPPLRPHVETAGAGAGAQKAGKSAATRRTGKKAS
jgi:glucose-1-phosphate adenylyltransferase